MSIYITRIVTILDKIKQVHVSNSLNTTSHKNTIRYHEAINEVYKDLGGRDNWKEIAPRMFDIELRKHAIILDTDIDFNRYRTKTLRSEVYDKNNISTEKIRRYNRTYEKECLKVASHGENWTNNFAEKHFGKSNDNGELNGEGSAKWKYMAFKNYLTDLTPLTKREYNYCRLSIYDTLMINEKLTPLKTLLLSNKESYNEYLEKYFIRILNID